MFTVAEAGGMVFRLTPTQAAVIAGTTAAIEQTIGVVGRRLESLQVKATMRREGNDGVAIDVPQAEAARLKPVITTAGQLTFRFVDTSMRVEDAGKGALPSQDEMLQDRNGTPYLVEKRIAMSGENLVDAQPGFDQRTNEPVVSFRFNAAGTRQFARITEEGVGKPMTVVLDGTVLAAPVIREPIVGGSGQISGNFTVQSANDLAIMLRSGALPLPLAIIDEHPLAPPAHR
jgi:preprotein translocase subunit SecD